MVRTLRDYLCTGCRAAKDRQQENGVTTVLCKAAGRRIDAIPHHEGMRFEDCLHRQNPVPVPVVLGRVDDLVRLAQIARTIGTADPKVLKNYEF